MVKGVTKVLFNLHLENNILSINGSTGLEYRTQPIIISSFSELEVRLGKIIYREKRMTLFFHAFITKGSIR